MYGKIRNVQKQCFRDPLVKNPLFCSIVIEMKKNFIEKWSNLPVILTWKHVF